MKQFLTKVTAIHIRRVSTYNCRPVYIGGLNKVVIYQPVNTASMATLGSHKKHKVTIVGSGNWYEPSIGILTIME